MRLLWKSWEYAALELLSAFLAYEYTKHPGPKMLTFHRKISLLGGLVIYVDKKLVSQKQNVYALSGENRFRLSDSSLSMSLRDFKPLCM